MDFKLIIRLIVSIFTFLLVLATYVDSKAVNNIIDDSELTNTQKFTLFTILAKERFSYFSSFVVENQLSKCMEDFGYSDLNNFLLVRKPLQELIKVRDSIVQCTKLYSIESLASYDRYLRKKYLSSSKNIFGIFSIKPEDIYFSDLENLAFSLYATTSLTEEIKNSGDYSTFIKYPQELEMESEIASNISSYKKISDYESGLKICLNYGMRKILLLTYFDKNYLVTSFKRFSHISKVLSVFISTEFANYNYKKNLYSEKKNSSKKLKKIMKKITLLQRLQSYVLLTKVFLSSDIVNFEKMTKIYNEFIQDSKKKV